MDMSDRAMAKLRQSVYSHLAGYEDTNDADRLAGDLAIRVVTSRQAAEKRAASTNTMSRFKTEVLTQEEYGERLAHLNAAWVERAMAHSPHRRVILDMDSSKSRSVHRRAAVCLSGEVSASAEAVSCAPKASSPDGTLLNCEHGQRPSPLPGALAGSQRL